ncbi:MAG TPA: acyltransferase family protein, partial [Candidatus Methylacidiphilales bacterium]
MRPGKWAWLGGLRFFLAAVVVATHIGICAAPARATAKLAGLVGFNAVLCFFLISGYSISCSIRQRPRGFLRRRFLRIYPLYAACLLLALVPWISHSAIASHDGYTVFRPTTGQALAGLFLLQGFLAPVIATLSPAWSLSVECSYYLLAPLLARLKPLLPWIAAAASFLYFRFGGHGDYPHQGGLVPFAALAWAWLLGWLYERGPKLGEGLPGLVFALFFVAAAGYVIYG